MTTNTITLHNQTYHNVTDQTINIDVSSVDEIVFSLSCNKDTVGLWLFNRLDAFNVPVLFQEGSLTNSDQSMSIGPSSSYDLTNTLGSLIQIVLSGGDGTATITVCVTGKAYT